MCFDTETYNRYFSEETELIAIDIEKARNNFHGWPLKVFEWTPKIAGALFMLISIVYLLYNDSESHWYLYTVLLLCSVGTYLLLLSRHDVYKKQDILDSYLLFYNADTSLSIVWFDEMFCFKIKSISCLSYKDGYINITPDDFTTNIMNFTDKYNYISIPDAYDSKLNQILNILVRKSDNVGKKPNV